MKSVLRALALLFAPVAAIGAPLDAIEMAGDLPGISAAGDPTAPGALDRPNADRDLWVLDGQVLNDDMVQAIAPPDQWARPADRHPNVLPGVR